MSKEQSAETAMLIVVRMRAFAACSSEKQYKKQFRNSPSGRFAENTVHSHALQLGRHAPNFISAAIVVVCDTSKHEQEKRYAHP